PSPLLAIDAVARCSRGMCSPEGARRRRKMLAVAVKDAPRRREGRPPASIVSTARRARRSPPPPLAKPCVGHRPQLVLTTRRHLRDARRQRGRAHRRGGSRHGRHRRSPLFMGARPLDNPAKGTAIAAHHCAWELCRCRTRRRTLTVCRLLNL
ncbi:hypothetical protein Dimus_011127, partial [Dionaea muscipula]